MENIKSCDICVIGAIVVDYIFEVDDFPREGEVMATENFFSAAGGGGAAQAVAAGKILGESLFAGQRGDDEAGNFAEEEVRKAGVNTSYLRKLNGVKTGVGYVTLTKKGQNSIINSFGANLHYKDKTLLPLEYTEAIKASKIVLLQRGIPAEINLLIAQTAHSQGKIVCLDAGGRNDPFSDELLSNLDFISPNENEVEKLVGCTFYDGIEEVLKSKLLSKFPNLKVLLRLGGNGCVFISKDHVIKVPVITKENENILRDYKIIDVTGAGDCWIGSFFAKYTTLEGKVAEDVLFKRSMMFANLCAFLSITKRGCIPSMPDLNTIKEFISKYLPQQKNDLLL